MLKKLLILSVLVTSGAWGNESGRVKEMTASICRIVVESVNCEKRAFTSKNYDQIAKKCNEKGDRELDELFRVDTFKFESDPISVGEQRQIDDAFKVLGEHMKVFEEKCKKNLRDCYDSEVDFHFEEFQRKCHSLTT